jgi:hypothetical protein
MIAIYHGFKLFHYEILGYIIDYLISSKLNFDIFSHIENEWKIWYDTIFNIEIDWFNPEIINVNNYNFIFLITDDDNSINNLISNEDATDKIICINHSNIVRRLYAFDYIHTRFIHTQPYLQYAIPCYSGITKNEKTYLLKSNLNINITCLGDKNIPISYDYLKDLFKNFDEITFHIIARNINDSNNKYDNIIIYKNCNTSIMLDILKKSNYILCFNNNEDLINKVMSGCIPLAFTFGCQLIIPEIWNEYYNFKSCISYSDNMKLLVNNNLVDSIFDECNELIHHRNIIFDKIIEKKYKINNISISWFSNIFNIFNIKKLDTLIIIGSNLEEELEYVKNDFRIIYILEQSNNIYTTNLINIYINYFNNNYILKNILNNINKPILINIHIENNNITSYLNILNKRKCNDIIILSNVDKVNNINAFIKNNYKKHYMIYPCTNLNKLIILPQYI